MVYNEEFNRELLLKFSIDGAGSIMQKNKDNKEFCIDDLGYLEEPLELKAIVMSKVLKELNIKYKRYYTSKSKRDYKRVKKPEIAPPDMSIAFTVECDNDYLAFAKYNYYKRMDTILTLKKAFESSDQHML